MGNPLPWLGHFGPLGLPAPAMRSAHRVGFSIVHYRFDRGFWTHWAPQGLLASFGPLWIVVLGGALLLAATATLSRTTTPMRRLLGLAAIVGMLGYLVTPFSAGGPHGRPTLFALDLRFLTPVLVLTAVALVRRGREVPTLVAACAVVFVDQWFGDGRWPAPIGWALLTTAAALLVALATALAVRLLPSRRLALALAVLTAAVMGTAWPLAAAELHGRYTGGSTGLDAAFARFRDTQDLRIGVGGFADDYPLYGLALDNDVQFVGVAEPSGGFRPPGTCAGWRSALRSGHYDYLVISRSPIARQSEPRERAWTVGDPAAQLVFEQGPTSVFRLHGSPDPGGCGTVVAARPAPSPIATPAS